MTLDPAARVGDLGVGQQQLVEIARAVQRQPRVLVLDEPTAALAQHEVATLLALVRRLRDQGVACVFISHKLDEVFAVADRITVLRDGAVEGTLEAAATNADEVIRRMVGRRIEDYYPRRQSAPGRDAAFAARPRRRTAARQHACACSEISLEVRAGEVLGIGGLMGAGRTELLNHLVGLWGTRLRGDRRARRAAARIARAARSAAPRARARDRGSQALRPRAPAGRLVQRFAVVAAAACGADHSSTATARSCAPRPPSTTCA